MDRSIWGLLGGTFFGASALGIAALGFVWPGRSASAPGGGVGKTEGEWRLLEPVSYENLTVFPVVSSASHDTSGLMTLEEGLANGDVAVREQGADTMIRNRGGIVSPTPASGGAAVNQLVLVNNSKRALLLLAGELVSGGKQDRIIAKDRIVPVGAQPLPLNVFCVEHGRWSQGADFKAASTIVHPSVREQAAVGQSQTSVWASVAMGTTAAAPRVASASPGAAAPPPAPRVSADALRSTMQSEAPTQSYSKLYGSRTVSSFSDTLADQVEKQLLRESKALKGECVVGVVVAYGGEVAWSDIFASGELFDQYRHKLIRSYAVEAVARPTLREKATAEDAQEFLQKINGRENTESEPGVYRWRETSTGALSEIALDALEPKVMTVHRLVLRRTS
jgi:hypothetical protein